MNGHSDDNDSDDTESTESSHSTSLSDVGIGKDVCIGNVKNDDVVFFFLLFILLKTRHVKSSVYFLV